MVSVPLRGKYRGKYKADWEEFKLWLLFPSPCGVNIVANLPDKWSELIVEISVSVPLRGKYRGKSLLYSYMVATIFIAFPSPCGVNIVANNGLLFLVLLR